jgi:hypothetical protein
MCRSAEGARQANHTRRRCGRADHAAPTRSPAATIAGKSAAIALKR